MNDLSLWFVFRHYTECFVHIKKCMAHKTDTKLSTAEIYTLNHVDSVLRESSYAGSVSTGFVTSAGVAAFVSYNMNSDVNRVWTFARIAIGIGIMWNIKKIMDTGSHLAIMFALPEAFKILEDGLPSTCLVKQYNQEFYQEFKEELKGSE